MKRQTLIALGSNQGNRLLYLQSAINHLHSSGIDVLDCASVYETEPLGFDSDDLFLNTVIRCETNLSPEVLMEKLLEIEAELGRKRSDKKTVESRCIDIDIVFVESEVINSPELTLPHPRLHERNFVLAPLNEIIPTFIHPVFNLSIVQLYQQSTDKNRAVIYHKPLSVNE